MGKLQIAISIDPEIHKEFVSVIGSGKVSGNIEDYMRNTISLSNGDIDGLNIAIIKKETEELSKKLSQNQTEYNKKIKIIEEYEIRRKEDQRKRLEREKEILKGRSACINCGDQLQKDDLDKYMFKNGAVCKHCFMCSTSQQVSVWNSQTNLKKIIEVGINESKNK